MLYFLDLESISEMNCHFQYLQLEMEDNDNHDNDDDVIFVLKIKPTCIDFIRLLYIECYVSSHWTFRNLHITFVGRRTE